MHWQTNSEIRNFRETLGAEQKTFALIESYYESSVAFSTRLSIKLKLQFIGKLLSFFNRHQHTYLLPVK